MQRESHRGCDALQLPVASPLAKGEAKHVARYALAICKRSALSDD
jgi:hypothetical protein